MPFVSVDMVLEGGSIHVDGEGCGGRWRMLATHDASWLIACRMHSCACMLRGVGGMAGGRAGPACVKREGFVSPSPAQHHSDGTGERLLFY